VSVEQGFTVGLLVFLAVVLFYAHGDDT